MQEFKGNNFYNENKENNDKTYLYRKIGIKQVWKHNFAKVIKHEIEILIEDYKYISIDTEFPGIVCRPLKPYGISFSNHIYSVINSNVNVCKIIQIGLTFYDNEGRKPSDNNENNGINTYQFNFKFNLNKDIYSDESIQLLKKSGINFNEFYLKGIDHKKFGEWITMSGLVLNDEISFICYHGCYDFAYLIKILTNDNLPEIEPKFQWLLKTFFPNIYDLKVLSRNLQNLKGGGLQNLADSLNIKRSGAAHQAGSDSLLTGDIFFKLRDLFFEQLLDNKKYLNILYGLGQSKG